MMIKRRKKIDIQKESPERWKSDQNRQTGHQQYRAKFKDVVQHGLWGTAKFTSYDLDLFSSRVNK